MIGRKNGLIQKLRQSLGHVFGIHCIAHRLNLKFLDAVERGKYIVMCDYTQDLDQ
jgi:hypothetical protein